MRSGLTLVAVLLTAGSLAGCAADTQRISAPEDVPVAAVLSPLCPEGSCDPVTQAYISHFTGANCTGTESYYTPYYGYDGVRRSWNGTGIVGTTLRTVTNRSYKDSSGTCYNAWPSGHTLNDFVTVYRTLCGEASCDPVTQAYISHFTGAGCTGTESYYTPYFGYDGIRRSWDGKGVVGTTLRTVTNRSYRNSSGTCVDAWPSGNTLSNFVRVYRIVCPESGGCDALGGAYISHFTGSNCTGTESYYTAYNGYDGIRRAWDGTGVAGTTLRTVTNVSYRDSGGTCYNAWPGGNTLSDFVTIYR